MRSDTLEDRKFFAAVMHRVSGVWKDTAKYRFPHYDSTASFSKHNRREAAASQYWEKSRRVWISAAVFLFVFALCLFFIPASLDDPLVDNREVERTIQSQSHNLPTQLKVSEEAAKDLPNKNQHPLKLRPDHFTLFNHSSSIFNPLDLTSPIRIYIYDLPSKFNDDWLSDERCSNHLFASEVAIHKNLLASPIRTIDPYKADFFFVPVYVSCKFSPKTGFPWLGHAPRTLQAAVNFVSTRMEFWNRSEGRDHVFVAAHDYGACFHSLEDEAIAQGIPKFMQNSVILQTFGVLGQHPCQEVEHIQIPPYIPPSDAANYITEPLEKWKRDIFAFFRGKMEISPKNVSGHVYSRGIRTALWKRFSHNKHFYLKRHRVAEYQHELLRSVFCLCPLGWAPWSPRIVEAVVYGCVPVIIADNISLPYSHVIPWSDISLTVRENDLPRLDKILQQVAATNLTHIQRNLWKEENQRAVLFSSPIVKGDATWHALDRLSTKLDRSHVKH